MSNMSRWNLIQMIPLCAMTWKVSCESYLIRQTTIDSHTILVVLVLKNFSAYTPSVTNRCRCITAESCYITTEEAPINLLIYCWIQEKSPKRIDLHSRTVFVFYMVFQNISKGYINPFICEKKMWFTSLLKKNGQDWLQAESGCVLFVSGRVNAT